MPGRQAKLLSDSVIRKALNRIERRPTAARDRVIFLLSVRAGLRACEIAGLDWSMVTDPSGRIANLMTVQDSIAKKGGGRRIPMHDELKRALQAYGRSVHRTGPLLPSARGGDHLRANSVVNWFVELFSEIGATGCSSHSGRRTFITMSARRAHRAGASLRDVQLLAGHRSIEVTQGYIDGDSDAQRRLVASL
ncbi:site-specific integrase [Brevundimonas sp.]|uniref:tyrosine-type recombinase/integrase n=1 Tax=Brevundimonas sp. TaxID=1871086 RepID=UPI002D51ECAF|nr:site-specific integrase [Brevundimonas sp.]HYC68903.1 site-specific integrase [Brevundimonas sp.]